LVFQSAGEVVSEATSNKQQALSNMLQSGFKYLGCSLGVLEQRCASLLGHCAARDFWAQHVGDVSHCGTDELRRALAAALPAHVADRWTARIAIEGHGELCFLCFFLFFFSFFF
jgi:hypothetical protein